MSSLTFPTFATAIFARFFVALLELEPSKKAIVLNLLLQNLHGPLKVVINDPDLQTAKLPQINLPPLLVIGISQASKNLGF